MLRGAELIAPGREGIRGLTIGNAAYLSTWKDDWVELPFDDWEFRLLLGRKQESEEAMEREVRHEELSGEYSERWSVRW